MPRYSNAEWVPWKYTDFAGNRAFYRGTNKPIAVVLHIMEGWASTARQWAGEGHYGSSWTFTIPRDGNTMQHLEFSDGGYQAGLGKWRDDRKTIMNPRPNWALWKGWEEDGAPNINNYTIGIEHEGMSGTIFADSLPFPPAQAEASKRLCKWLAQELDIPFVRERFPSHADIALIDRANDFAPAAMRERFYEYLFSEEDMPDPRVDDLIKQVGEIQQVLTGYSDPISRAIIINDWLYVRKDTPDGSLDWNKNIATGATLIGWMKNLNTALLKVKDQVQEIATGRGDATTVNWTAIRRELQDVVDAIPQVDTSPNTDNK